MNCKCSGNNSLRNGIGGIRCECGGPLELNQVLSRIVSRLDECDEQNSALIQALVAADMGECGHCGKWFKESQLLRAGERALCEFCWDPWFFLREEDEESTVEHYLPLLMREVMGGKFNNYRRKTYVDLLPKDNDGVLLEPFLTEYRKHTV